MPVEDLGQKKLLSIMDKEMKRNYQMPTIKVVAFRVEAGFNNSDVYVGDRTITTEYPTGRSGIQAFGDGRSYGTVFGDPITNSGD